MKRARLRSSGAGLVSVLLSLACSASHRDEPTAAGTAGAGGTAGATSTACDPPSFADAQLEQAVRTAELTLTGNPLDPRSRDEVVPALCARGYTVFSDATSCGTAPG